LWEKIYSRTPLTKEKLLKPDAKGRISLGKMAEEVSSFKAIYENEEALKSVRKGLMESARGQLKDRGSFSKYIKEKQENT